MMSLPTYNDGEIFAADMYLSGMRLTSSPISIVREIVISNVPHYEQRKDSRMFCMDLIQERQPGPLPIVLIVNKGCPEDLPSIQHHWIGIHPAQGNNECDHCYQYCARASVQMMNHFFKGAGARGLSQDRISLQRSPFITDPADYPMESGGDLGHDHPMWPKTVLYWALGLEEDEIDVLERATPEPPTQVYTYFPKNSPAVWSFLCEHISAQRPVILSESLHSVVVTGMKPGKILVQDPSYPNPDRWLKYSQVNVLQLLSPSIQVEVDPKEVVSDEPSIWVDGDGDRICTFDEANRLDEYFDPTLKDTDPTTPLTDDMDDLKAMGRF